MVEADRAAVLAEVDRRLVQLEAAAATLPEPRRSEVEAEVAGLREQLEAVRSCRR